MRRFLIRLVYSPMIDNGMTWLSGWHWCYLMILVGATVAATLRLRRSEPPARRQAVRVLAWALPLIYAADFFIMPLSSPHHDIAVMKLPFHICTLLSVVIPFVQFHHRLACARRCVAVLALVCASAYLFYPGSALANYAPYSYVVVQTMLYHGTMLAWAALTVTGDDAVRWRDLGGEAVMIVSAQVWATLGNRVYSYGDIRFDWLMMTGQSVPWLPLWLVPFGVFGVLFGGCLLVHAVLSGVQKKTPPDRRRRR